MSHVKLLGDLVRFPEVPHSGARKRETFGSTMIRFPPGGYPVGIYGSTTRDGGIFRMDDS